MLLLVTSQVSHAITDGDLEASSAHLQAAAKLRETRSTPIQNMALIHYMKIDAKRAAVTLDYPTMTLEESSPLISIPSGLRTLIEEHCEASFRTFPRDFPFHIELLSGLHGMALTHEARISTVVEAVSTNWCYTHTLHRLSRLAAECCNTKAVEGSTRVSRPTLAIALCLEFFGWEHCPVKFPWVDHPGYMKRLSNALLAKLHDCLDLANEDALDQWTESGASLVSLLWVLVMGIAMSCMASHPLAPHSSDPSLLFLQTTKNVVGHLGIVNSDAFEQALQCLPWTTDFCGVWCRRISSRLGLAGVERSAAVEWPPRDLSSCCHGACDRHAVDFLTRSQSEPK